MKESKVFDIYNNASSVVKEEFLLSTKSTTNLKTKIEKREFDYSWIDIIEETIRYLENIVMNPKKFIVNEEEVIAIEKAKRVTVDSIIHLTQHTNYIQDYNKKTGDVMPSRILNISKEETFEMYENRFIYSLISNLKLFISTKEHIVNKMPVNKTNKTVKYQSQAKVGNETISINLDLVSDFKENKESSSNVKERLKKIKNALADISNSEFYTALAKAKVALVRSPIKRTNVILKNPNFQKAVELWEFIEKYYDNDIDEVSEKTYGDLTPYQENLDDVFLINYLTLNNFDAKGEEEKFNKFYISSLVNKFVLNNDLMSEKDFNRLLKKEFKSALNKKKRRQNNIAKLIKASALKNNKINKKAVLAL